MQAPDLNSVWLSDTGPSSQQFKGGEQKVCYPGNLAIKGNEMHCTPNYFSNVCVEFFSLSRFLTSPPNLQICTTLSLLRLCVMSSTSLDLLKFAFSSCYGGCLKWWGNILLCWASVQCVRQTYSSYSHTILMMNWGDIQYYYCSKY